MAMHVLVAKLAVVCTGAFVFVAACGDASAPGDIHEQHLASATEPTETLDPGFGWDRPITAQTSGGEVTSKLGNASATLAGHSLREVVVDPAIRVRSDDIACTTCHSWAPSVEREAFCARVSSFLAQPTSTGSSTDPPNAKPALLKALLEQWQDAGCPD